MTFPDRYPLLAAPPNGGAPGGGSFGGGSGSGSDKTWLQERGEIRFRIEHAAERQREQAEAFGKHRDDFMELRTEVLRKLEAIDGKLGLLGFKAGIWAALLNGVGIMIGLLLLYWKIK